MIIGTVIFFVTAVLSVKCSYHHSHSYSHTSKQDKAASLFKSYANDGGVKVASGSSYSGSSSYGASSSYSGSSNGGASEQLGAEIGVGSSNQGYGYGGGSLQIGAGLEGVSSNLGANSLLGFANEEDESDKMSQYVVASQGLGSKQSGSGYGSGSLNVDDSPGSAQSGVGGYKSSASYSGSSYGAASSSHYGSSHGSNLNRPGYGNQGNLQHVHSIHGLPSQYRCLNNLAPVKNAILKCDRGMLCMYHCIKGYQFPNGRIAVSLTCLGNVWHINGKDWALLAGCEPTCLPPCLNGGICVSSNTCQCQENFSGSQCQIEKKQCLKKPPRVMNAKTSCSSTTCTVTCRDNHKFPDGTTAIDLSCRNGVWWPVREDWVSVPDCIPRCDPPCQNGGICMSLNTCQCPQDFRGLYCQYRASVCHPASLGFNGAYNCSGDKEQFSCKISCPEGSRFSFRPAAIYTCLFSSGEYLPKPIPHCIFGSDGGPNPIEPNHSSEESWGVPEKTVTEPAPKKTTCYSWSGAHYKTFDGYNFDFLSNCAHILVRDAVEFQFTVAVKHLPCQSHTCASKLFIYVQDQGYTLGKGDDDSIIFRNMEHILPIPSSLPGITVTMVGSSVKISLTSVGSQITWDTQDMIEIEADESLWNRTEGLCGVADGHIDNDVMTMQKTKPQGTVEFIQSWQFSKIGFVCNEQPSVISTCNAVSQEISSSADAFCNRLLRKTKFKECSQYMDISYLLHSCKWDYCACENELDREECACKSFAAYAEMCVMAGCTDLKRWRDLDVCPMKCSGGKEYMSCGPTNVQTCTSVDTTSAYDVNAECVEGCFCPSNTFLHEGRCITRQECPCKYRNRNFSPGSVVPKDCNTCTCVSGEWVCTQITCGARCSAYGDPHYTTFDGTSFDFMGECSYHLLVTQNLTINVENVECPDSLTEGLNYGRRSESIIASTSSSCTKSITILYSDVKLKLHQMGLITVGNSPLKRLPSRIKDIVIRQTSSLFISVKLPNGVIVLWDGFTRLYVDVPASFRGKTRGLCGTFNNYQKDDFLTPEGDIEQNANAFANKWRTKDVCLSKKPSIWQHPCKINVQNKENAETHCAILKSEIFKGCHWFVDVDKFYENCLYDVCACTGDLARCLCPTIGAYAMECASQGHKVEWRPKCKDCEMTCSGGQTYQVCANSCMRTCSDLVDIDIECKPRCVEGCACAEGQVLNNEGRCVQYGECPCYTDGIEYHPGYKEIRPGKHGDQLCTCNGASWECHVATLLEQSQYPKFNNTLNKCKGDNIVYTNCEPPEPITCKNMHKFQPQSAQICQPGCTCKEGYVLDVISKTCVLPERCPCHHGGNSYPTNGVMQQGCNTCTCSLGKWNCTKFTCDGVCTAWGDSHFTTFDGKDFDFQGACTYMFAQGSINNDFFSMEITNEACGTTGATCSKVALLKIKHKGKEESLTISKGTNFQQYSAFERIKTRTAGLTRFVEIPSIGLRIQWDGSTRFYLMLSPRWRNRVSGLCGNYNNDNRDDFQTPSGGGVAEASALLFADSWRVKTYCVKAVEVMDYCVTRPARLSYATERCSALRKPPFTLCHNEVDVVDWEIRCRRDACACDVGDDCQCVCAALAAYAQACAMRGVIFEWRCQEQCPMQCTQNSYYHPCISACPLETCDNTLDYADIMNACKDDSCVEGCQPKKSCPPGQVFQDGNYTSCITRNNCKPMCLTKPDGQVFLEGEIVHEDDCQICTCSRGKVICVGEPCSTEEEQSTTETPPINPSDLLCKPGWTEWVNQEKPRNHGSVEIEPIPTLEYLRNIPGSAYCDKSQMVKIQCSSTSLDNSVAISYLSMKCTVESGLECKAATETVFCDDFKIRVKCDCDQLKQDTNDVIVPEVGCNNGSNIPIPHPTDCHKFYECGAVVYVKTCGEYMMFNPLTYTCDWSYNVIPIRPECQVNSCPDGEAWSPCAIQCDKLCHSYKEKLIEINQCTDNKLCQPGCTPIDALKCKPGYYLRDKQTCVKAENCPCLANNKSKVKPGQVHQEDCMVCQCLNNYYACDESACAVKLSVVDMHSATDESYILEAGHSVHKAETTTLKPTQVAQPKPLLIVADYSTPPPALCPDNRYVNLLYGESIDLSPKFSASSSLTKLYGPEHAVAHIGHGGIGSWRPETSDDNQYIQIGLKRKVPIYGISLRGNPLKDQYVTAYQVLYGDNGFQFAYIKSMDGSPMKFRGSTASDKPAIRLFSQPIEAKYIRIHPTAWKNDIAIRLELIGCDLGDSIQTTTPIPTQERCEDNIGLMGGLPLRYVKVSSEKPASEKTNLVLELSSGWQPMFSIPGEWVMFDFTRPRIITGLNVQGGSEGMVTVLTVKYSNDLKNWNAILDSDHNEMAFDGNFDNEPVRIYFPRDIRARYLKVIPLRWERNIELKVEPIGCSELFDVSTESEEQVEATTPKASCNVCPGVVPNEDCKCTSSNDFYNGWRCVTRAQCPCVEGKIHYEIGTSFHNEKCEVCLCKLGGQAECGPPQCPPCQQVTNQCTCDCYECPEDTRFCPTSKICIPASSWCDGIQDCSDDEIDCPFIPSVPTTTNYETTTTTYETTETTYQETTETIIYDCHSPVCPKGYTMQIISDSEFVSIDGSYIPIKMQRFKPLLHSTQVDNSASILNHESKVFFTLSHPQERPKIKQTEACVNFRCVAIKDQQDICPIPKCPPGYEVHFENIDKKTKCKRFVCLTPALPDNICTLFGRTFKTFDGVVYKYDVCDHLLVRSLSEDKWAIIVQKKCDGGHTCSTELVIIHENGEIRIKQSLQVEYNGIPYTTEQVKLIGAQMSSFTFQLLGESILFTSLKYKFWTIFDVRGNIKIGVSQSNLEKVDGLCGYYNAKPEDDRRLPSGFLAESTELFGHSWARPGLPEDACKVNTCPPELQKQAWDICVAVYDDIFSQCAGVLSLEEWRSQCLERFCDCAMPTTDAGVMTKTPKQCLCDALQTFVTECQALNKNIVLNSWRIQFKCPISCPPPFVYKECHRGMCQPTCGEMVHCPNMEKICLPGCYCPDGYLFKGNKCVQPNDCMDCKCEGTSHSLETFTNEMLHFDGNCTYVLARDYYSKKEHQFEVFATNTKCNDKKNAFCTQSLHVLYQNHTMQIQKNKEKKKLDVLLDGKVIYNYPIQYDWLHLSTQSGQEIQLSLPQANVELNTLGNMEFRINMPSAKYSHHVEGVCGVCNSDGDASPKVTNGSVVVNSYKYKSNWLSEVKHSKIVKMQIQSECIPTPKPACKPLPKDKDQCYVILDKALFGHCHPLVDPYDYLERCQKDFCDWDRGEAACEVLEEYAHACLEAGVCLDWRNEKLCPYTCEAGMQYRPCHVGCSLTCENYELYQNNPKICEMPNREGCFCPDGMVWSNDKCIETSKCYACDANHFAGDVWQIDACTICKCEKTPNDLVAHISCTKVTCSESVCPPPLIAIEKPKIPGQCCVEHQCVEPSKQPDKCPEPQFIMCSDGQILKTEFDYNKCPYFVCVCKPKDRCDPLPTEPTKLDDGLVIEIDESGCCPIYKYVCKPETCSPPPECHRLTVLETHQVPGQCCPVHTCSPPQNKCIVKLEYEAAPLGGEQIKQQPEYTLYEVGASWLDGPCRSCKCNEQGTHGCVVTHCPPITDSVGFVAEPHWTPYVCCPSAAYVACRHDGQVYKLGESWIDRYDKCKTYKCNTSVDGKLEKSTTVQQCETNCQPGWIYVDSKEECCGECKPVACVQGEITYRLGEIWYSQDGCVKNLCTFSNNAVQIQSTEVSCPSVPEMLKLKYEIKLKHIRGQCCPEIEVIGCRDGSAVYKEGESWTTHDPCVSVICALDSTTNQLVALETMKKCAEECQPGWRYIPPKSPDQCCGHCEAVACVAGDVLKPIGSTWQSGDKCVTYSCERINGQVTMSAHREVCPKLYNCPPNRIYKHGCCLMCETKSLSQSKCVPTPMQKRITKGLVKVVIEGHGICKNVQPIRGLNECKGSCDSGVHFNNVTGGHDSECSCCQATSYGAITIKVVCSDRTLHYHKLPIPIDCDCKPCDSEALFQYVKAKLANQCPISDLSLNEYLGVSTPNSFENTSPDYFTSNNGNYYTQISELNDEAVPKNILSDSEDDSTSKNVDSSSEMNFISTNYGGDHSQTYTPTIVNSPKHTYENRGITSAELSSIAHATSELNDEAVPKNIISESKDDSKSENADLSSSTINHISTNYANDHSQSYTPNIVNTPKHSYENGVVSSAHIASSDSYANDHPSTKLPENSLNQNENRLSIKTQSESNEINKFTDLPNETYDRSKNKVKGHYKASGYSNKGYHSYHYYENKKDRLSTSDPKSSALKYEENWTQNNGLQNDEFQIDLRMGEER